MKTILVVEDEAEMRRNLVTLLRLEGYRPVDAADGREGLEVARREKPDLILCDVMMPRLDGHGLVQALRADPALAHIPLIFLTARGEKAAVRCGMNLGADDYLTKPVGNRELVVAIEARLKRMDQVPAAPFEPDFSCAQPLEALGLTPRVAEALLWVAQGKTNAEVATILGISESTVKKHLLEIFQVLGVETRSAATLRAIETLAKTGKGGRSGDR